MTTATPKVVDFTNVKDAAGSFNTKRVPSGDYLGKVVKVEDAPAKGDGVFMYLFTIKLEKYSQYSYPYYCKLTENQLWKLRNLLIAAGINVPKKRIKLDPSKVVGKFIGVTMEDDEYEGKAKSVISSVFPASELGEATDSTSDDDDEPAEDEETPEVETDDEELEDSSDEELEEEATGDEFDGMDRTALKVFIKGKNADFRFLKSQSDDDLREAARAFSSSSNDSEDDELEELDISDL